MQPPILHPAIPQFPSGDLQRTADFFRDRLDFTDFRLFSKQGHLIVRRDRPKFTSGWPGLKTGRGTLAARAVATSAFSTWNRCTRSWCNDRRGFTMV
jgi:hypothetical protein